MINQHFTATGTTASSLVYTGTVRKALIQVNAALTGTITVDDSTTATAGGVAIITNPTVGSQYEYWGFRTGLHVYPSTTCDITVSADLSFSGK